ncbi:MAG TPA: MlaD family protein [Mycobacteriales bacterium]|nr:MlaD family protein [Mycobacteriales bacterium]HVX69544.1 MlaD family protein [Mycobacteriales bacterium]HWA65595.1 MlaD family protein [Mycobacteriales bacterium]
MIRRVVKIQLAIFLVLSLVGIVYVGASYVGINPLSRPFTVKLALPSAGGIFTNADVAERGVVVGRVGALHINPDGGVIVDLEINHGEKIPSSGLTAKVADLSAVGEQYVELEPASDSAPYLTSDSQIKGTIPVDDAVILRNVEQLFGSIDVHDLSTTVTELGKGFANLGPSLQKLITGGQQLTQAATDALPATQKLINDGKTVLDTQRDVAAELKSFAASFDDVTGEFSGQDAALRTILDNGSAASDQLKLLIKDNQDVFPELLSNLDTFTQIESVRLPYDRAVLELYPAIVADSYYALPAPGNVARFGMVTDAGAFCSSGYASTKPRSNKPKDWGGAANLDAHCFGNNAFLDTEQNDIRGERNAPHPKGDHANVTNATPYDGPHYGQPFPGSGVVGTCDTPKCPKLRRAKQAGSGVATASDSAAVTTVALPYDPTTGVLRGLDGKTYELGLDGPLTPVFGSSSYTWLLLAPTMR